MIGNRGVKVWPDGSPERLLDRVEIAMTERWLRDNNLVKHLACMRVVGRTSWSAPGLLTRPLGRMLQGGGDAPRGPGGPPHFGWDYIWK
jgi:hypothetical protein